MTDIDTETVVPEAQESEQTVESTPEPEPEPEPKLKKILTFDESITLMNQATEDLGKLMDDKLLDFAMPVSAATGQDSAVDEITIELLAEYLRSVLGSQYSNGTLVSLAANVHEFYERLYMLVPYLRERVNA